MLFSVFNLKLLSVTIACSFNYNVSCVICCVFYTLCTQMRYVLQDGMDWFVGPKVLQEHSPKCHAPAMSTTLTTMVHFTNSYLISSKLIKVWISLLFLAGFAYRQCDLNGSWVSVENRTWVNYSDCLRFLAPGIGKGKVSKDDNNLVATIKYQSFQPLSKLYRFKCHWFVKCFVIIWGGF